MKSLVFGIIVLFLGASVLPTITGDIRETKDVNGWLTDQVHDSIPDKGVLNSQFIYRITENLSYIIFTEYNESNGEIAKGRAFGTKGEHKAADILYENMSKLGLYTTKEPIQNIPEELPEIATELEVQAKGLTIYNKTSQNETFVADCYISPRWNFTVLPKELPESITNFFLPGGLIDCRYHLYNKSRLTYNFSYANLKVIRKPTEYSLIGDLIRCFTINDLYVYIGKDYAFTLYPQEPLHFSLLYKTILKHLPLEELGEDVIEMGLWSLLHPKCKGLILYDSNNDTYNMNPRRYWPLPIISINGTLGKEINQSVDDFMVDFYVNQSWNESVESYNVIGQLNGTNPNETIIVCSLYDSWWCQGTGDSAIGMAMVLGIAKYFIDHNITPKCNVKFIAFGGEEGGNKYGRRGAYYYEAKHRNEIVPLIIDINQVGFTQTDPDPRLTFHIWINNESLNSTLRELADGTNYIERTGNVTDFTVEYIGKGGPSNVYPFAVANRSYNTILFAKDFGWIRHHRDGEKHTKGDVMDYYNETDVNVTAEMIWNITKYFTVDPNCWFENIIFTTGDSPYDEDDLPDSINVAFTIKVSLPHDLVMVNASLWTSGVVVANKRINYTVTSACIEDTITLTVPEDGEAGWYTCLLLLYNSTGRINEILHLERNNANDTSLSPPYYLYPYGAESDWSNLLKVCVLKNKLVNTATAPPVPVDILGGSLEQHPHMFPILRHLLRF